MRPDYTPPRTVVRSWDGILKKARTDLTKQLASIKLFQNVGQPWKGAGNRFKQISFDRAMQRLDQRENIETRWQANPNLNDLYKNQSQLLNIRRMHFTDNFGIKYDRKVAKAFRQMLKRLDQEEYDEFEDAVTWAVNDLFRRLGWERLNADVIQAPFCELEFQILVAGHLPALPDGKDWTKCKLLYC